MSDQKALDFIAQAEKKLKSAGGFFGNMLGTTTMKYEEAAELYKNAANAYKTIKKTKEAGDAMCEAGKLMIKYNSKHEAATTFVEAGNAYRKTHPDLAVNCYLQASELYADSGKLIMAAKQQQAIAEIYESELVDLDKSLAAYEQAAEWFETEDSPSAANKCLLNVAKYCAQMEKYPRAIEIYMKIGKSSMESSLLKYGAKEYFLKAVLCHLAHGDLVAGEASLVEAVNLNPAFVDSREHKLLSGIISAYASNDAESFTAAVAEYDTITRLDAWMTTIMLRIKRQIGSESEQPLC